MCTNFVCCWALVKAEKLLQNQTELFPLLLSCYYFQYYNLIVL